MQVRGCGCGSGKRGLETIGYNSGCDVLATRTLPVKRADMCI